MFHYKTNRTAAEPYKHCKQYFLQQLNSPQSLTESANNCFSNEKYPLGPIANANNSETTTSARKATHRLHENKNTPARRYANSKQRLQDKMSAVKSFHADDPTSG